MNNKLVRLLLVLLAITAGATIHFYGCTEGSKVADSKRAGWSSPADVDPTSSRALQLLDIELDHALINGRRAMRRDNYEEALKYYLYIAQHDLHNDMVLYNVAACYGRLGKAELSAGYLERSFEEGFDGIGYLQESEDFDPVREDPAFATVLEKLQQEAGEKEHSEGKLVYVKSLRLLQCRIQEPDSFDPDKAYPLVIGMHGYGSSHDEFIKVWNGEQPFIYAVPQAPYPFMVNGEIGYSWMIWQRDDGDLVQESSDLGELYIRNVIDDLSRRYKISKVYLMGFSMGCSMAYFIGLKTPDMVDGIIGIGGMLGRDWHEEGVLEKAAHMPVLVMRGDSDRSMPPREARETMDVLEENGFTVSYYEYAGGHEIPEEAAEFAASWVDQQQGSGAEATAGPE